MKEISVTRKINGEGLGPLEINHILFLEYDRAINRILVHTKTEIFYTVGTLVYWVEMLNNNGYNFARADRNGVINLSKVEVMDQRFYRGYFEAGMNGKFCPFAKEKFNLLVKELNCVVLT
ncbi:hypothetical protein GCM10010912_17200 [Paenibacillus albidus]|uniref:HTH LytTR-type domain-containing protein n=1 Tax=Paenibacillus albidus TaxID=2041023 RepID=A0A917C690_9BACL|nr:LytTR family transcriptional regulator DNA-binding domain-containing protein [Paenibacillus albidus]GGF72587.1 hypothetical protein GCM10010912_17200 [Paenibacillus albidus]